MTQLDRIEEKLDRLEKRLEQLFPSHQNLSRKDKLKVAVNRKRAERRRISA